MLLSDFMDGSGYDPPMFAMFRNWRRRRAFARIRFDIDAWSRVVADLQSLSVLDETELARLRDLARLFMSEKSFEPSIGFRIDDTMRMRIAALACRPILELGIDCYHGFIAIIVYPSAFVVADRESIDEDGVVHVGDDILSGEAWEQGPVILAWDEVLESGRGDGYDVVAHEFAHKLDLLDGATNGVPALHADMRTGDWIEAFRSAFDDLQRRLDRGEDTWIDPYAAEEPSEFFAVCTELFFDAPKGLQRAYPDVYAQLVRFYRQDPLRSADVTRTDN